jgi:hypothetical protein
MLSIPVWLNLSDRFEFMHSENEGSSQRQQVKGNWRIHGIVVIWCLLAFSTEHWFPGWSGAIAVGGAVPALIVYSTSKAWCEVWYWVSIAVFALLQVPLMIYVQPLIVRFRFPFLFLFAFADYLAVMVIMQCVALVFSKVYARSRS